MIPFYIAIVSGGRGRGVTISGYRVTFACIPPIYPLGIGGLWSPMRARGEIEHV
ncbi:hypothetical protein NBRC116597_30210 [Phaeobacter sp. NW0010-22]